MNVCAMIMYYLKTIGGVFNPLYKVIGAHSGGQQRCRVCRIGHILVGEGVTACTDHTNLNETVDA